MRDHEIWAQVILLAARLILPRLVGWVFGDGDKDKAKRIRGRVRYQVDRRIEANFSGITGTGLRSEDFYFPEDHGI